jgi:hypothetical protein
MCCHICFEILNFFSTASLPNPFETKLVQAHIFPVDPAFFEEPINPSPQNWQFKRIPKPLLWDKEKVIPVSAFSSKP